MALSVLATIPKGDRQEVMDALHDKTGVRTTLTNEGSGQCVVTITDATRSSADSVENFFKAAGIPYELDRTVRRTVGR